MVDDGNLIDDSDSDEIEGTEEEEDEEDQSSLISLYQILKESSHHLKSQMKDLARFLFIY